MSSRCSAHHFSFTVALCSTMEGMLPGSTTSGADRVKELELWCKVYGQARSILGDNDRVELNFSAEHAIASQFELRS